MASLTDIVTSTPYISKSLWGDPLTARVNLLSKPPIAIVKRTTTQSIANGTVTQISWDTVVSDPLGIATTGVAPFTVPYSAAYLIIGNVGWAANATGTRLWNVCDGANSGLGFQMNIPAIGGGLEQGAYAGSIYKLNAGNQVGFQVYQSSGGALNVSAGFPASLAICLLAYL